MIAGMMEEAPKPRLLDRVRFSLRARHYSIRTEEAYVGWIRRFILFHGKRHPLEMGEEEVNAFLTSLAVEQKVSASTQTQALSALVLLTTWYCIGRSPRLGCTGMLRIGLILRHQLDTGTDDLIDELLHQADDEKALPEREIYRRSLKGKVIDQPTFDDLNRLYSSRNRVVHRYIISEITTEEVETISREFKAMISIVSAQIYEIEEEQLRRGVGMTRSGKFPGTLADYGKNKHGSTEIIRRLWPKAT